MGNTYGISIHYAQIMRISSLYICLQLFALYLFGAHNSHAQTISIDADKTTVQQVFKDIEKQAKITFSYERETLADTKPLTLHLRNKPLKDVLSEIAKRTALDFQQVGNVIVVNKKKVQPAPKRPVPENKKTEVQPQQPIRGKVTDQSGNPIAGATISVKGTNIRTVTDTQGDFILHGVQLNADIEISYIGFETIHTVAKENLKIAMQRNELAIQEVGIAVSTGYQSLSPERTTGSFAKVDNKLFNRQVSTDVISRLKGIAPSILFDERSALSSTPKLTIRGMSTIFGNAEPLVVVDGFVYDGDIQNINPNDVEDIDILRDAGAASIWGVRAGNGVIVITTKRGKANEPMQVEVGSNVTFLSKPNRYYQTRMNPSDMVDVEIMLFNNDHFKDDLANTTTFPFLTPVVEILAAQKAGSITEAEATRQIDLYRKQNIWDEIDRYLYRTGVNQQHNLNMKGGTDKYRYYFSAGYDNNKSNQAPVSFDRLTLNAQQIFNPIKNLEITTGINYTQSQNSGNNISINTGKNYNARLKDDDGNHLPLGTNYRTSFVNEAEDKGLLNWQFIPLDEVNLQNNRKKQMENRLKGGIKYAFIPSLSAEASYQYQRQNNNDRNLLNINTYSVRDLINRYSSVTPTEVKRNIPLGSTVSFTNRVQQSHTGRFQLNYNQTFDKHNITAIGGFEVRQMTIDGDYHKIYGYVESTGVSSAVNYVSGYLQYPSGYGTIDRGQGVVGIIDRFRSWYSNLSYTYNDRYTISGSTRIDQSNLFGVDANQRSVPLWSIGGKYLISKEDFYQWDAVPSLSVRATYGYNGNLDNSITAYTTARVESLAFFTTGKRARIVTPPNANLQWERTGIFNLGVDFGTKNSRITGSIDYFSKKNNDLIGQITVDPTVGMQSYRGNYASTKGQGLDLLINTVNITNTRFNWTTQFLYSYATDEVTKYDIEPTTYTLYVDQSVDGHPLNYTPVIGRPLFGIYSHDWAGLDPATGSPRGYLEGEPSTDYITINRSIADDPIGMLNYHGRALPPHFGAIRNTFSYHDVSLSFNITYRFGHFFRRSSLSYSSLYGYNGHPDYTLRWKKPGDELMTDVPAMAYPADANADSFYAQSEIMIERGDHIRLQDINLSYYLQTLPFLNKLVNSASLFIYGNNLALLWTANDKGIDPDFPTHRPIRTFAVGFRANF
ncbi:SusC/RagA family TonB-linked outer membrane protein [Sphingobacterium faecale]|uniref:SusC/RagA family TonB-linked outer membrane protein n=1 Tax=Sphingobacterium faecale TaxID=2803775 RepID=A0ABS1RAF5_9SPHI|nr:SusC/RagA family TonB-linked outer membrane protein [Sphingobacterium faecale]MBL1410816.1 SusC/RagA family TonB-linked outer membrane protein [Sphingobacterium faecale]